MASEIRQRRPPSAKSKADAPLPVSQVDEPTNSGKVPAVAEESAIAASNPGQNPDSTVIRAINARRRGSLRYWLLLSVIILAGAAYGIYWFGWIRGTVTTDDAHVNAPVFSPSSRLSGRVQSVLVSEGDLVQPGQLLATIADDKILARLQQMQAVARSAEIHLHELRNSPRPERVAVALAEVRVREVNLTRMKQEMARANRLAKVNAISEQDLENARADVAESRSELSVSEKRLDLLNAGSTPEQIQQAAAALRLALARVTEAESDLADTKIHSTIQGVIAMRMLDPGEHVDTGQALFQIVDSTRSWVIVNLEEGEIADIRVGQKAHIWVDAYPGQVFLGRVGPSFHSTLSKFSLLPSSSASGSFVKVTQRVPVRVDWVEEDLPHMYPGLNAVVRIFLDDR